MPHYRKIRDNVYVIPGSPVSLVIKTDSKCILVDPGMGSERPLTLSKALGELGVERGEVSVLISHSHYDHIEALTLFIKNPIYTTNARKPPTLVGG